MGAVSINRLMGPPIQERRWVANGMLPDGTVQGGLCNITNQIARYRPWEIDFGGPMGFDTLGNEMIPISSTVNRDRWIGRCHTGPFTKQLGVRMLVCQTNYSIGTTLPPSPPGGKLTVTTTAGGVVGVGSFTFGINNSNAANVPSNYGWGTSTITVAANSDYILTFTEVVGGRLVSATVYEIPLDPDTANGYLQSNYAAQMNIYDTDRSGIQSALSGLWKHSGFPVLNWSCEFQSNPQVSNLTTPQNLIDILSTSHDSSTPGWTRDLTNCQRLSQSTSGVPAVLAVFGKWGGASGTGGSVRLVDTNNWLTVPTLTGFSTAGNWLTTTVNLFPGTDKYDLQFWSSTGGTNFSVYGAVLYLHES